MSHELPATSEDTQPSLHFGENELSRGMMVVPPPNVTAHLSYFNTLLEQPGQLILITGEPGSGKASLLHHGMLHTAAAAMPRHHASLDAPTAEDGVMGLVEALWPSVHRDHMRVWEQRVTDWCDKQQPACLVIEGAGYLSNAQLHAIWSLTLSAQQAAAPLVVILTGIPELASRCASVASEMVFTARSHVFALEALHPSQSVAWLKQQMRYGVLRKLFDTARLQRFHEEGSGVPREVLRLAIKADHSALGEEPTHIVEQAFRWLEERRQTWWVMVVLLMVGLSGGWMLIAKPIASHGLGYQIQHWIEDVRAHTKIDLHQSHKPLLKRLQHHTYLQLQRPYLHFQRHAKT